MRFGLGFGCAILACVAQAFARSSTGDSVLVILEPSLKREDYSIYFRNLESVL